MLTERMYDCLSQTPNRGRGFYRYSNTVNALYNRGLITKVNRRKDGLLTFALTMAGRRLTNLLIRMTETERSAVLYRRKR